MFKEQCAPLSPEHHDSYPHIFGVVLLWPRHNWRQTCLCTAFRVRSLWKSFVVAVSSTVVDQIKLSALSRIWGHHYYLILLKYYLIDSHLRFRNVYSREVLLGNNQQMMCIHIHIYIHIYVVNLVRVWKCIWLLFNVWVFAHSSPGLE